MNHLIIGNKNYSSWSLRPWLLLTYFDIPFEETRIPLYTTMAKNDLLRYSPAGQVPIFQHEGITVWDSLAICEFIAERYPELSCWPSQIADRARARSICCEMHSGFNALRSQLPMNCRLKGKLKSISPELQSNIDRVQAIWQSCRQEQARSGPFLFGAFSIADAMYAPVVLRFESYGIEVGSTARAYMDAILEIPAMQTWIEAGRAEVEYIEKFEVEIDA